LKENAQRAVARAVDKVPGIGVIRDHRMLHFNGTNRVHAQSIALRRAKEILAEYQNPMAAIIWGDVVKRDESIRLCFMGAKAWESRDLTFDKGILKAGLEEALGMSIAATSIAAINPIATEPGRFVADRLEPLVTRLRDLAAGAGEEFTAQTLWTIYAVQGTALSLIGDQRGLNSSLNEATGFFELALKHCSPTTNFTQWVITKNNLGNTLTTLGTRASSNAILEKACQVFRVVLDGYPPECRSLDWATTHHNLANATRALGELQRSVPRLEEASDAYRSLVDNNIVIQTPILRATIQNNLGTTLSVIGDLKNDAAKLGEAIAYFREASKEWARRQMSMNLAASQNNLGNALARLGEIKSDVEFLKVLIRGAAPSFSCEASVICSYGRS